MIHVDEDDPVGELEPSFPYKDVTIKRGANLEEQYELLTEVGRGKFGTVYHCREKATGLELAAKFVTINRRDDRRNVEREVDIMRQLQHPRLIQLYDALDSGKTMCVVLELINGGELFERVIDDDFVLTEKACTVFMRQICEGIEFVHQQNILHLDMKPENILCLTKTGNRIKIIDFGLARKYDPSKKLQVLFGTPEFVAPEIVNFDQIGFGTDMWSIGVICYVLLSGLSPFMGETDVETMANVTIAKYDFDDEAFNEISEDAKDFIAKLLVKDKQNRMTAQQCIAHRWLQKRPTPPIQIQEKKFEEPKAKLMIEYIIKPPQEELDISKDNLRLFVERWSEHPNSPYLFDVSTHEITPCVSRSNLNGLDTASERSIGGCSPSPCASLSSLTDSLVENDNVFISNKSQNDFDDSTRICTPHSLERRASDSSCFVNKKIDICQKVNLAEEIKKLSDRLYMLSTMNTDLVNNNVESSITLNSTEKPQNETFNEKPAEDKLSKHHNDDKHSLIAKPAIISNRIPEHRLITGKNNIFQRTDSRINGVNRAVSFNVGYLNKNDESYIAGSEKIFNELEPNYNLPWARKKFKITNQSRDVPIMSEMRKSSVITTKRREVIDNLVSSNEPRVCTESILTKNITDKHFYKKTDENVKVKANANDTKNLLLQLLNEWGESKTPTNDFHAGRHKSVSMEFTEAESLATNSMNSINTFYKTQLSSNSNFRKKQEFFSANGSKC